MDIFDETKAPLKAIWNEADLRQKTKIVIMGAIGNTSDISVRQANEILEELDRTLLDDSQAEPKQINQGL